jgi:hypothetical protein
VELGKFDVRVYPNPAGNWLHRVITPSLPTRTSIEIFDGMGKKVRSLETGGNSIDVSGLKSGFYLIRFNTGGRLLTAKFAKQ